MNKLVNLSDLDLSLKSSNYASPALGKYIKNLNSSNGRIQSSTRAVSLYNMLGLTNAGLQQSIMSTIGEVIGLYSYQTNTERESKEYLIFCSQTYKIFYLDINLSPLTIKPLENVQLSSLPKIEFFIKDGKNLLLISSKTDDLWVWDGENLPYDVLNAPKITGLAVGLDRLFVASSDKPYSVLYSEDLDPTSWGALTKADEIMFSDAMGKVINVFALQNYVFVLREHGIVKIYASSNNKFTVSKVYSSTGKIYENSFCMCGDKAIYLASDGLYSFDGLNSKKIYSQIDELFKNVANTVAECIDNKVYLFTNFYSLSGNNNAIIILDLATNSVDNVLLDTQAVGVFKLQFENIRGVCLLISNEQKTANLPYILSKTGDLLVNSQNFEYLTNDIQLDKDCGNKVLRYIEFTSAYNVNLQIDAGGHTKYFTVKGSNKVQRFLLSMPCKTFSIKFYGSGLCDICDICVCYSNKEV